MKKSQFIAVFIVLFIIAAGYYSSYHSSIYQPDDTSILCKKKEGKQVYMIYRKPDNKYYYDAWTVGSPGSRSYGDDAMSYKDAAQSCKDIGARLFKSHIKEKK